MISRIGIVPELLIRIVQDLRIGIVPELPVGVKLQKSPTSYPIVVKNLWEIG